MNHHSFGIKYLARLVLRLLPLFGMIVFVVWLRRSGHDLSLDTILSYTPAHPVLAALFMLLLFTLKGVSLLLPVLLLQAACGVLFPLHVALPLAILGTAVSLTIPFFIGRGAGPDMTERLQQKYRRLGELRQIRMKNEFFCAFLVRVVGILPCDVVSLYLGNTRMRYGKYILGGVLGFLPDIVTAVVVGMKADDRSSPWFWGAIAVNLLVIICATTFYAVYRRRHFSPDGEQA